MINLIPPMGHRTLKREYFMRVGATLAFLLGGVFLILTVALIPTYVLIGAQVESLLLETAKEESRDEKFAQAESEVKEAQNILTQLTLGGKNISASVIIEEIEHRAQEGIVFKNFIVSDENGVIERVQVQGIAPTRSSLSTLKNSLEGSPLILKAEVPIADLARDVDLPFAITVTLDKTEI